MVFNGVLIPLVARGTESGQWDFILENRIIYNNSTENIIIKCIYSWMLCSKSIMACYYLKNSVTHVHAIIYFSLQ